MVRMDSGSKCTWNNSSRAITQSCSLGYANRRKDDWLLIYGSAPEGQKSLIWQILEQTSISFGCPGVLVVQVTTGEMFHHSPTWRVVSDVLYSNR